MSTDIIASEVFFSSQGEGPYTNRGSAWIRFYNCNLQCDGFSQKDPTDPSTYELPYKIIDISKITKLEELPVFEKGCDSSYSWSAKFKHLQHKFTAAQIVDKTLSLIPGGKWKNTKTGCDTHLVFTGGEPLLPRNQRNILAILTELESRGKFPEYITFETNGTQTLIPELIQYLSNCMETEILFSVSPKLFTVSGEQRAKAIKPEAIVSYDNIWNGVLIFKFVVNGTERTWQELEEVRTIINSKLNYVPPTYIMPLGATLEEQDTNTYGLSAGQIANDALARGYYISPRVHVVLWGNTIGC